jgi:tripeptide aminopeptidase
MSGAGMDTAAASPAATDQVVRTFMELAALPSPAREEGPAAEYVREFLDALDIEWSEDDAAARIPAGCGNITARLAPTGEGTPIFFCVHLDTVALEDDVVPVLLEDGRITNEREAILGGDNKAAVAVVLELLRELVAGEHQHAGVEAVFTPCEEIGLVGAKHYDPAQLSARYGFVFDHANDIGKVVARAPSQVSMAITFTGVAAHSGIAPEQGRSAIVAAADAIGRLKLGRIDDVSTANIGMIEGGTAVNIVPERCHLRGEVRSLDHDRVTQLAEEMVAAFTDAAAAHGVDVDIDAHDEYLAYELRPTSPVMKHACTALRAAGYEPELVPCGGGSDANVFNAAGLPAVNMCNGMRLIHTSEEYILASDLTAMLRVAREIVHEARA